MYEMDVIVFCGAIRIAPVHVGLSPTGFPASLLVRYSPCASR
jgi:hypothetical protein